MIRFIYFIIWLALWVGIGDALINMTLELAAAAKYAHQEKQLSYKKVTDALIEAKPKKSQKQY